MHIDKNNGLNEAKIISKTVLFSTQADYKTPTNHI